MIIGNQVSADGGARRKTLRKSHIVNEEERMGIISFLNNYILNNVPDNEPFTSTSLFPEIPLSIQKTPLLRIYNICNSKEDVAEKEKLPLFKKHLGMLIREALYLSEYNYYERFEGSNKSYKRTKIDVTLLTKKK